MANLPADHEDDLYELAPPAPADAGSAGVSRRARPAVAPMSLAYRAPSVVAASGGFDERQLKDFQMPLWFLCGGIVIEIVAGFVETRAFAPAMRQVGVNLIIGTGLMLVGILLAARARGIELGQFWTVVLKLAAISVGPSAVVRFASPVLWFIPLGGLLGWVVEFGLYFALLGVLFDLDESDTWYCVCVIFLVRLAVYFALLGVLAKFRWG